LNECIFIILGATGDLTKRKLIPAIYKLIKNKKIEKFAIIGVASSQTDINTIIENSKEFISESELNLEIINKLKNNSYYYRLDFYNSSDYQNFKNLIEQIELKHSLCCNKIFYFATLPEHFKTLTENLAKYKIVEKHESAFQCSRCKHPWSRIVYEKPFGNDLKSAKEINKCISRLFYEKQIYRIDHYLGKELVGNIAIARFTNTIFEPLWNNKYIESVQITLSEKIGIEGRGKFYNEYGAIKDIIQNHALQILALVTMEQPKTLTTEDVRDAKSKIFKKVKIEKTLLGQYEGYTEEKNVDHESKTETFAAIKLYINNKRWKNVPFYIKTGKYLDKKESSITIKFKPIKCLLPEHCPTDSNKLIIKIEPDEGFYLELNAKVPGRTYLTTPVIMNFCHSCLFGPNSPAAYENLLYDVINGDQFAFVRSDEIELSWKIVEQIDKSKLKLYKYKKGSTGPTINL